MTLVYILHAHSYVIRVFLFFFTPYKFFVQKIFLVYFNISHIRVRVYHVLEVPCKVKMSTILSKKCKKTFFITSRLINQEYFNFCYESYHTPYYAKYYFITVLPSIPWLGIVFSCMLLTLVALLCSNLILLSSLKYSNSI